MWNEISDDVKIREFLEHVNYFHDTCIKEIRYISGAWVNEDLSMHPINEINSVEIIFQCQFKDPCTMVIKFIDVDVLHLAPVNMFYTCEILDAAMFRKDDLIFWANDYSVNESNIVNYTGTWISAKRVVCKAINSCLGQDIIYRAKYEEIVDEK